MTPVSEDPPVITPPGDRGLSAAVEHAPAAAKAGPLSGCGNPRDASAAPRGGVPGTPPRVAARGGTASPVPVPPVHGTGLASSSSPQPPPDAGGDGCGARVELPGGASEYAAGEPPAEDAPRAARTPDAAARGGTIPDDWGVLIGEARLLADGGKGAQWWAAYRKRQQEDRITPLDAPPGCCHIACEDGDHARWLEGHMAGQGVPAGLVKAVRLPECATVALEGQEDAAGGATAMDSVRAETSRQKAAQRRGRGRRPPADTYRPGMGRRLPPPDGAA